MSKTLIAVATVCLTSTPVYADKVDLAVEAFHRTCLAHGPDFERTVATAVRLGWSPLSGKPSAPVLPADGVDAFQRWLTNGNDMPVKTMIAVAKATLKGKAVQTCSIMLFDIDRAAFEERFFARTDAVKIGEDRIGAQVSKLYILIADNRKQLVHLTFPRSRITSNTIIASSIAED
ncbi:hypothetical protein [Mesorhizobium sp. M0047]|uniref:hypothetical protein n=1 Tax=Mesorhizobium sp. M0047 TaxID=2956859 RepID=UPI0033380C3D